ncbi:MAG: GGDEF domain-containing protein, partial [Pseudomonadota bacterium]
DRFNALVAEYHKANQAALAEAEADFRRAELTMLGLLALAIARSLAIAGAVIRRSRDAESALAREHEAAVAAADKLSWAATHDSLTGLVNRREMRRRLGELVQGAHARGEAHVLLYIDLDRFKAINDACGHLAGDEALRQVAHIFMRHVRSGDLVARIGGDEFAIGLANCDAVRAAEIAEAIRQEVAHFSFAWEGRHFALGASIGLVVLGALAGVDEVLKAADAACYAAKAAGRNQVAPSACDVA